MIKLLVLDMDGTLIYDNQAISEKNQIALHELMSKGGRLCLASGRNVASLCPYARQLKLSENRGFLIGGNGQEIYDCYRDILIKKHKIPNTYCHIIVNYAITNHFEVSGNDEHNKRYYYRPDGCTTQNRDFKSLNFNVTKQYLNDECDIDKLGIYLPKNADVKQHVKLLSNILDNQVEIHVVNSTRIEFTGKGINKVVAIKEICKQLKLNDDEVMVIGD